jgi:hypothetical protein
MSFFAPNFFADGFFAPGFWAGSGIVDQVAIQLPKTRFREGSTFTVTANFREDNAAIAPEHVHYRIDCLTTGKKILDWTEVTTAASVSVSIKTTIKNDRNRTERKQVMFSADQDTDNEAIGTAHWIVGNFAGIS